MSQVGLACEPTCDSDDFKEAFEDFFMIRSIQEDDRRDLLWGWSAMKLSEDPPPA